MVLTEAEWTRIRKQLKAEYEWKPSIFIIREVMRRELGFTIRTHRAWNPGMVSYTEEVHLDFYDPAMETWFRLKYL